MLTSRREMMFLWQILLCLWVVGVVAFCTDISEPRNCKLDVNAEAMRVQGSCEVPKIYASDDNYVCQWLRRSKNEETVTFKGVFSLTSFVDNTTTTSSTTSTSNTTTTTQLSYKTGTCSFSAAFFLVEGIFNFSIHTSPGSVESYVATVTVDDRSNVTVSGADSVNVTVSQAKGDLKKVECVNNKTIDAEEGEVIGLTCESTSGQVTWSVIPTNSPRINVAACNTTHCSMQQGSDAGAHSSRMLATRPNASFSELYVDVGAYRDSVTTFSCYKHFNYTTCKVRAVYSARPTNFQFNFNEENSTVSGSCHIPKIYNASNLYQCQWIEQYKEETERIIQGSFLPETFTDNGQTYKRGTCSFSTPLFEIAGTFTYRVAIAPGHQEYIASIDVAVNGETTSLTISGRGHLDTRITHNVTEVQFLQCNYTNYDVRLGARVGLTCSKTQSTLRWNVYPSRSSIISSEVASCNATQCTMRDSSSLHTRSLLPTRPTSTSSILYVDMAAFFQSPTRFYCSANYSYHCTLRTVYSSPATNCQLSIDISNATVSGSCFFEKLYNSDSSYACNLVAQHGDQASISTGGQLNTTSYYDQYIGQQVRRGNCSLSSAFFLMPGTVNLSIEAKPGFITHLAFLHIDEEFNVTVAAADDVNITIFGTASEVQLLPCGGQVTFDVSLHHAQVAMFCSFGPTRTLAISTDYVWQTHSYAYTIHWNYFTVATCTMTTCSIRGWSKAWFMATRPNSTVSIAYVNMRKYTENILNVKCSLWSKSAMCKIRLVYSAPPSNCRVDVNIINKTVSVQCDIARIQASDGVFKCTWTQMYDNQMERTVDGFFDRRLLAPVDGFPAFNATCSSNFPLIPIADSNCSYYVHFHPGQKFLVASVLVDEYLNITLDSPEDVTTTLTPGDLEAPTVVYCSSNATVVDVDERGMVAMVCPRTLSSFKWQYKSPNFYYYDELATCNATFCTLRTPQKDFMVTRPNASLSVLHFQMRNMRYYRMNVECTAQFKGQSMTRYCFLRPVYPASLMNCSLHVDADHMMVRGSCDVEKVYSSDSTINCTWIERFKNQTVRYINGNLGLRPFKHPVTWKTFSNGSCSFTAPLLMVNGVFRYSVHVKPGSPKHIATLYLDGPSNMTLVGEDDVRTSLSGTPTDMNLYECRNGETVDIPENGQAGLVCRATQGEPPSPHLKWVVYPDGPQASAASSAAAASNATCNVSSCEVWASGHLDMLAVRPNASASILYLSLLGKRDYHHRAQCWASSRQVCVVRSVYSAQLTNCQFDFNTTTYTVQGSCEVTKVYSSDGQYSCNWIQQVNHENTTSFPATSLTLKAFQDPLSRLSYRSGVCEVTFQLLRVPSGSYVFSINVSPGTSVLVATLTFGTDNVTLTGGYYVTAKLDGVPQEYLTTTATSTTPEMTSEPPTTSSSAPRATVDAHKKLMTYVGAGVGGTLGVILVVVVIVIGIWFVRKAQGRTKLHNEEGYENESYFYTSRQKSDNIADVSSTTSTTTNVDSGQGSSSL